MLLGLTRQAMCPESQKGLSRSPEMSGRYVADPC